MKTVFCLCVILICFGSALAQLHERTTKQSHPLITVTGKDTFLLEEIVIYWLDTTGKDESLSHRDTLEYYDNGLLKSSERQFYNTNTTVWTKDSRTEYFYESNDIKKIISGIYIGNYWQTDDIIEYEYGNFKHKPICITYYSTVSNNYYQDKISYNNLGFVEDSAIYDKDDKSKISYKFHYSYNDANLISSLYFYNQFDTINPKTIHYYNYKNQNLIIDSVLRNVNTKYNPYCKTEYYYSNDSLYKIVERNYDTTKNQWYFVSFDSIYFDYKSNTEYYMEYNEYQGKVSCEYIIVTHYDNNGLKDYDYSIEWLRTLKKWRYQEKYYYKYAKRNVGIVNIKNKPIQITYQSNDKTIQLQGLSNSDIYDLEVFNLLGICISKATISNVYSYYYKLNNDLPYGIYLIAIKKGNYSLLVHKFIIY